MLVLNQAHAISEVMLFRTESQTKSNIQRKEINRPQKIRYFYVTRLARELIYIESHLKKFNCCFEKKLPINSSTVHDKLNQSDVLSLQLVKTQGPRTKTKTVSLDYTRVIEKRI